jgi:hypothetical protein
MRRSCPAERLASQPTDANAGIKVNEPVQCKRSAGSGAVSSHRRQAFLSRPEAVAVAGRIGFAFVPLRDHFRLRLGDDVRVAEFRGEPRECGVEPADLYGLAGRDR